MYAKGIPCLGWSLCGGLQGWTPRAMQTCPIPGGGWWLNDGAPLSPSHSSFFMVSKSQKQKLLTLDLKLFVTCAEEMSSTAFCLGLTWVNMPRRLAQKSLFRCHFCLSKAPLHESHSQASFSMAPKLSSPQSCLSSQSYCVTLALQWPMLLPDPGPVQGASSEEALRQPGLNVTTALRYNLNVHSPHGDLAPCLHFSKPFFPVSNIGMQEKCIH